MFDIKQVRNNAISRKCPRRIFPRKYFERDQERNVE